MMTMIWIQRLQRYLKRPRKRETRNSIRKRRESQKRKRGMDQRNPTRGKRSIWRVRGLKNRNRGMRQRMNVLLPGAGNFSSDYTFSTNRQRDLYSYSIIHLKKFCPELTAF